MIADILIGPAGLAGLSLVHPSARTAGLGAMLDDFDAFHDPPLEERRRHLRRVLAQIAAMDEAFG